MCSLSVSVWKWNWVLTQDRRSLGTYSSQISGGSTTWLSQSKIGKSFLIRILPARSGRLDGGASLVPRPKPVKFNEDEELGQIHGRVPA